MHKRFGLEVTPTQVKRTMKHTLNMSFRQAKKVPKQQQSNGDRPPRVTAKDREAMRQSSNALYTPGATSSAAATVSEVVVESNGQSMAVSGSGSGGHGPVVARPEKRPQGLVDRLMHWGDDGSLPDVVVSTPITDRFMPDVKNRNLTEA